MENRQNQKGLLETSNNDICVLFLHFASKLYAYDLEMGDFSVLSTISLSPSHLQASFLMTFFFFFALNIKLIDYPDGTK